MSERRDLLQEITQLKNCYGESCTNTSNVRTDIDNCEKEIKELQSNKKQLLHYYNTEKDNLKILCNDYDILKAKNDVILKIVEYLQVQNNKLNSEIVETKSEIRKARTHFCDELQELEKMFYSFKNKEKKQKIIVDVDEIKVLENKANQILIKIDNAINSAKEDRIMLLGTINLYSNKNNTNK